MAHYYTIARPYAKAIFAEAKNANRLQEWAVFLSNAAEVAKNAQIKNLFSSPSLSPLRWTDFFSDISGATDVEMKNLLKILAQNKRLEILPDISDLFWEMMAESKGQVEVEVISSTVLDETQKSKFLEAAKRRFSAKIEMRYSVDESLIGGAIMRAGNWVIDGSIKSKIARMRESLC